MSSSMKGASGISWNDNQVKVWSCVSSVNLGFDNPSMRMEEDRDNLEGVL